MRPTPQHIFHSCILIQLTDTKGHIPAPGSQHTDSFFQQRIQVHNFYLQVYRSHIHCNQFVLIHIRYYLNIPDALMVLKEH